MDDSNDQSTNAANANEKNGETSTVIRVLTVCAYLLCVSLAAIGLSIYYIFLWEPKRHDPSDLNSGTHGNGVVHRKH